MEKLDDLQLSIVLCRLHDGESMLPDTVKALFYEQILGLDASGGNYDARKASPDPFLRSMALWQMKDYESSLQTLLEVVHYYSFYVCFAYIFLLTGVVYV